VHATRPFTGDGGIESWAKKQKDKPSRSEAIRRLIEIALGSKLKDKTLTTDRRSSRILYPMLAGRSGRLNL
jgi:hypothetical protein